MVAGTLDFLHNGFDKEAPGKDLGGRSRSSIGAEAEWALSRLTVSARYYALSILHKRSHRAGNYYLDQVRRSNIQQIRVSCMCMVTYIQDAVRHISSSVSCTSYSLSLCGC